MITEEKARRLLPHIWHGFFGRFGRLTPTQAVAIEPIVAGKSVVLCAPTASGKTEAVMGPLIERLIQGDREKRSGRNKQKSALRSKKTSSLRLLAICPTRALCNDLQRRIHRPISDCGWKSDVKTGDSPSFSDDNPPQVLVTTPESFDSLLSRRPAALRHVDALFLDELHLLDGSARGDQLRALVFRLQSFRPDLQICAASATAADAERLAFEFAGEEAEVVTATGGGRDQLLDAHLQVAVTLEDAEIALRRALKAEPGAKILAFANTRAEVEWLAAKLSDLQAFAHHGSLSRGQRLRSEKGFLRASSGVCVATMTMELGVDIGDVDRVMLINPPPNVASFTQRVGRSNRRGGRIQATCLYSTRFDKDRFEHMIACAEEGRLFPEKVAFRPTIIPQQAISLISQNPDGWVSAKALHARLPTAVRRFWTEGDCAKILALMRSEGYLHADSQGRYVADVEAENDYKYGRIHAHIENSAEVEVIDEATGRKIGTASWTEQDQSGGTDGFVLGGKHRDVTRVKDRQIFVKSSDSDKEANFLSRMGPRYSFDLARDLAAHLGHDDRQLRFMATGDRSWRLQHFFGTLWGRMLCALLRSRGFRLKKVGPFFADARLSRGKLPRDLGPAETIEEDLQNWLHDGYKQFVKPLEAGPWRRFVPDEMMRRWVIDCVRPQEFAEEVARFELVDIRKWPA